MLIPTFLLDLARPWATLFADAPAVGVAVTFVHFGGLVLGGGSAMAVDREMLLLPHEDPEARTLALASIRRVHRWVLYGLIATVISGLLFLASDLETFLGSPVFWVKMGLFLLLLANGAWLQRTERRDDATGPAAWRTLRRSAGVSLVLWTAILLFSILVTTAA